MVSCTHDGLFLKNDREEIIGISLGFDFYAEHECGFRKLLEKFNCPLEKKHGISKYKIQKAPINAGFFTYSGEEYYYLTTYGYGEIEDQKIKSHLKSYLSYFFKDGFYSAWDSSNFAIILKNEQVYELLVKKFSENAIFVYRKKSFLGGGLTFLFSSAVTKEEIKQSEREGINYENKKREHDNNPVFKKLKEKQKLWREKYPDSHETPWDSICLSFHLSNDGKIMTRLNPQHQQHLYWGLVTFQDIDDWAEGKVGTIIPSKEKWEALNWLCKGERILLSYNEPFYNFFPKKYINTYRGEKLPEKVFLKRKDGEGREKFSKEFVRAVEGHLKAIIAEDLDRQKRYDREKSGKALEFLNISRECDERLFGFFEMLRLMGYGFSDAYNSPKTRENLSFWKELLIDEVRYEDLISRDPPPFKDVLFTKEE